MDRGEALMEFILPPELRGISADVLLLALQVDGPWNNLPQIDFYEWESESWQSLERVVVGENRIANPEGLINDQGLIRLRVSQENAQGGYCTYLGLGLEGTSQ